MSKENLKPSIAAFTDPEQFDQFNLAVQKAQVASSNPDVMKRFEKLIKILAFRSFKDKDKTPMVDPNDFDLEAVIRFVKMKHRQIGLESNSAGVAFRNLSATGIDVSATYCPSIGEFFRSAAKLPVKILGLDPKKPTRKIIRNINGVVRKGEMLFVIGRPGSGCSTLLKCVAGETSTFKSVEGEFCYDGLNQEVMIKNFKGYVIYNPELDFHFPHLTVNQTLEFAAATRTPKLRVEGVNRDQYIKMVCEILTTVFGLTHAAHTKVGNDYVRGVSGGERKRVSLAEALATNASIYAWDNATRGLDASTALEFVRAIRSITNLLENASLIAIYQAGEHIYEVFDKVTVLYRGRQVYFGPANEAKDYFIRMGWECPARMTSAEFLTSVTDPNGRTPRPGFENQMPSTADEFEQYWVNSPEFQACIQEYDSYVSECNVDETYDRLREATTQRQQKRQMKTSNYILSYSSQLKYLIKRGIQRVKGDISYTVIRMCIFVIISLIAGSLFYDIPNDTSGAYSRGSVAYFALLFMTLSTFAEISNSFAQRPIVLKQKSYSMYHPSAEAIQQFFSEMPNKFFSIMAFTIVVYFMTNLKLEAGSFFTFWLFLNISVFAMTVLFQTIASLSPDVGFANSIAGVGVLALSIYTGFMVTLPQMHPWFKWISYINPLRWSYEAIMSNEFHGQIMDCVNLIPTGPGYENVSLENQVCSFLGSVPGQSYVLGDDYIKVNYQYSYSHIWRNLGILIGWMIGFLIIHIIASEFVRPNSDTGDVLLFKRGFLPEGGEEKKETGIPSAEEMIAIINGPSGKADFSGKEVFTWKNVDYVIPAGDSHLKLLEDVQGFVKPGTMTALMGESGAGKTTLLNVLSQRISFGVITGDMFVDGKDIDSSFQRRTGYVQQQDLHLSESSVRESLRFSALLRRPESVPKSEKYEYVEKIIGLLGMQEYAESMVGVLGKGLNVEQRKKLSIGVELVAKPELLLFLDEPTSGLDSQSAWSIIQFLRSLADSGQAILCTIHQPSATLFEIFDRLLLLKKGGKTVYFGDIGKDSRILLDYFERQSGVICAPGNNPAEYILERIGAGATAKVDSDWYDLWVNSPEYESVSREIDQLQQELKSRPVKSEGANLVSKFATGYFLQLFAVFKRTGIQLWRRPDYILAKFMLVTVGSLFVGFTFWKANSSVSGTQNVIFAVFIIQVLCLPLINQIQSFALAMRDLFEARESASNTFHWSCLLLSQVAWEVFYSFLIGNVSFFCFFWTVGFSSKPAIAGYFYFVLVLIWPFYYVTLGLWVIYFSPDVPSAASISSLLFTFMMSFCGVLQPAASMVGFWTFMYKVSPMTYFIQSLLGPAVHNKPIVCDEREFSIFHPPSGQTCGEFAGLFARNYGGHLDNPTATESCRYCASVVGDQVVLMFGVKYSQRWRNVGFFAVYIIFNVSAMLLCYYLFRVRVWGKVDYKKLLQKFTKEKEQKPKPQEASEDILPVSKSVITGG